MAATTTYSDKATTGIPAAIVCGGKLAMTNVMVGISEEEAEKIAAAVLDLWSDYDAKINCITYANGYWVVGGLSRIGLNQTTYARIAYATDPSGEWTTKDLWSGAKISEAQCIAYADGYWVVGGRYQYSSKEYARIAYTTDLSGEWTTKDLWSGDTYSNSINCVTYADGYWVVVGRYDYSFNSYARIAYTTDPSGEWTAKDLWGGAKIGMGNCVTYADGYWVVGGNYQNSNKKYACIAYTTDLSGEWTTKDFWIGVSYGEVNGIAYANGYWVVSGRYDDNTNLYARVAYTTDLSGEWTTKDLWGDNSYASNIIGITYADGYWAVGGDYHDGSLYYSRIAYATDPSGEWTTKDFWGSANYYYNHLYCVTYADGYWVVGGEYQIEDGCNYARIMYSTDITHLGEI